MQFTAKVRFIKFSPYKLRPLVDKIRGKGVQYALDWLSTVPLKNAAPIRKLVYSAAANAKDRQNIKPGDLAIAEVRVDQGPVHRYFKPSAMGRSQVLKRRTSHISIIVKSIKEKEARGGSEG